MRSALTALAAFYALAAPSVQAATAPGVTLATQMFVERVETDINGRSRRILTSPTRISRGDQIIFIVDWRNQGAQPLRDVALSVPGTVRIDPNDPRMQISVDGGARWGRIGDLWLPTALGGVRRATAEDVTHIRWAMPGPVAPGRSGRLSYRATIR